MTAFLIDHPTHGPGQALPDQTKVGTTHWTLRKDSGGTVKFTATREQLGEWTNARAKREEQDAEPLVRNAPRTINVRPAPRLIEAAMEHFEIPLGGALKVLASGSLDVDTEAEDFPAVVSALTGVVLADYATATMVIPSNVRALQQALDALIHITPESKIDQAEYDGHLDTIQSVVRNFDGLMARVSAP